ncbi:MAG: DUF1800 family protein, partial [Pseudomonadota bacterium]
NYRDLIQEVTYSPAMADYLTYLRNRKADPERGRMPDENYARELLQLFTIGLVELNPDGTPRLGPDGNPIELFDNEDIQGLARVFTGLSLQGTGFFGGDAAPDGEYSELLMFDEFHEEGEKVFLGTVIPAGTLGDDSITMALDAIFAHPNVGPFISRQLIQRFTASDPDPAYVARVAAAFDAGAFSNGGRTFGTGERGDLQATLAAILLDPGQHGDLADVPDDAGKIREPILKFAHWARVAKLSEVDSSREGRLRDTSNPADRLGQHPFRSPSVFNFYRPGFVAPGTVSGEAGKTAPELQIINEASALGYANFMTDFILDRTPSGGVDSFVPDYSDEIAVADDVSTLVDRLALVFTAGQLTAEERSAIEAAVSSIEILPDSDADDRRKRVEVAMVMMTATASFGVVK